MFPLIAILLQCLSKQCTVNEVNEEQWFQFPTCFTDIDLCWFYVLIFWGWGNTGVEHFDWHYCANFFVQVPDYYSIIRKPMDFQTMQKKCARLSYSSPQEFVEDAILVFSNAATYNQVICTQYLGFQRCWLSTSECVILYLYQKTDKHCRNTVKLL